MQTWPATAHWLAIVQICAELFGHVARHVATALLATAVQQISPVMQLVALHATAASTGAPASRMMPPELELELEEPAPLLLLLLLPPLLLPVVVDPEDEDELEPLLELTPVPPSSPPAGFASPPHPPATMLTAQTQAPNANNRATLMAIPFGQAGLQSVRLDILAPGLSDSRAQSPLEARMRPDGDWKSMGILQITIGPEL
jgi:hypothetical protein